ncbi:MAG: DUF2804 domain-containing protein [Corallococcus sp.]|nr:DUF2804 domain-containing protein [Corallococcus sp.]
MIQTEITKHCELLDSKGNLAVRGWARHMYFDYDNRKIKKSKFKIKEWDFYQISDDMHLLQVTIGHVSYCSSVSANLINIQTGERFSSSNLKAFPLLKMGMEFNGENPHKLQYSNKGVTAVFDVTSSERKIYYRDDNADAEISVTLGNCSQQKDKTVIATPFDKPRRFYLNYKENCYSAQGEARFGNYRAHFGGQTEAFGLLDWGRGVWPFEHKWVWANGSTRLPDGKLFGFNLGWGFGNTQAATENMFFVDNKAYKLGNVLCTEIAKKPDGLKVLSYKDEEGLFDFTFEQTFNNRTETKVLFVNNQCNQIFGKWSGSVVIPDGTRLQVQPFTAFCEWAHNHW